MNLLYFEEDYKYLPKSKKKILAYLQACEGPAPNKYIAEYIGISRQACFTHIKQMTEQKILRKINSAPQTKYGIATEIKSKYLFYGERLAKRTQRNHY